MSANGAGVVYLNGEFTSAGAAKIATNDDGLLFGLGFFETFRTVNGTPHLWPLHRARLESACRFARIQLPPHFLAQDVARLRGAISRSLEEEKLSDGVFRYTVTAGSSADGVYAAPGEMLAVRPLPSPAPARGVTLRVLALRRDTGEWLPRPKSLNYANALLGARELQRRGAEPHEEGLFLARESGHVVEAVRHNVLWVAGDQLCFPDPALGAVAGTGLDWVRSVVSNLQPKRVSLEQLLRADAVMLVNSVRGITPVARVMSEDDRAVLGAFESHAHPRVVELRTRWEEALRGTGAAMRA